MKIQGLLGINLFVNGWQDEDGEVRFASRLKGEINC
jgi:hypothetical protein